VSFGGNAGVRMEIHEAATMAAMAFSQAGLGICHSLSHTLGGMYHIPHGRLNAILLPAVISVNAQGAQGKYAALARDAGFSGAAEALAVRNLKNGIIRLRRELRLPGTLAEAGVKPADLRRNLATIVASALKDPCCNTNPVEVTASLLEEVLRELGKEYEFHRYDGAGHGFWYYDKPMYRQEQAMDSWNKCLAFLDRHLKQEG